MFCFKRKWIASKLSLNKVPSCLISLWKIMTTKAHYVVLCCLMDFVLLWDNLGFLLPKGQTSLTVRQLGWLLKFYSNPLNDLGPVNQTLLVLGFRLYTGGNKSVPLTKFDVRIVCCQWIHSGCSVNDSNYFTVIAFSAVRGVAQSRGWGLRNFPGAIAVGQANI